MYTSSSNHSSQFREMSFMWEIVGVEKERAEQTPSQTYFLFFFLYKIVQFTMLIMWRVLA